MGTATPSKKANGAQAARTFLRGQDPAALDAEDPAAAMEALATGAPFRALAHKFVDAATFSLDFADDFVDQGVLDAAPACRALRGAFNMTLDALCSQLAKIARSFADERTAGWEALADRVRRSHIARTRLIDFLAGHARSHATRDEFRTLATVLERDDPHALYPTSPYRVCDGKVASTRDGRAVEATMTLSTFASVRMVDNVLDPARPELRDLYGPIGRCVCLVDTNVQEHHGARLAAYFAHHGIGFEPLVYRAMEADKGLGTVERMLGDFKRLGVSRSEPVLIAGGGVLADTGGLACALYGRGTPYAMLATSIVAGIDAGPSPRTCCDGFGYKNLLGAYHPPVLCLTDRYLFGTLEEGWLRHGVAEIIKMAIVADEPLFADLETAQPRLVETRFGIVGCGPDDPMHALSTRILGAAMRDYVASEYDNLYETHQCRPHAYGHTWSPGFEIEAGLLHGHAVAICMGLGAHVAMRASRIDRATRDRILALLSGYGLSLWHDILLDEGVMRESHRKIVQKRGGNLVAPIPSGGIGRCGYLNDLAEDELLDAIADYRLVCEEMPGRGLGIQPLCVDVGLEAPSTVGR